MKIKQIVIKNFGKFQNKAFSFSPGLNVVYGENESGKSTLHTFLLSMLFGLEKARGRAAKGDIYTKYQPWNTASFYSGDMDLEVEGKPFHLERNFYHKEKSTSLCNMEDGEELSVEYGDLQMLLGGMTKEMYENTYCISQSGAVTGKELAIFVQNYMANVANTGEGSLQLHRTLMDLQNKKSKTAKEIKEETGRRELQIEKLQMERELLEEDIERIRSKKSGTNGKQRRDAVEKPKRHVTVSVLLLGCFLTAGWFVTASILQYPWKMVLENGGLICLSTAIAAVIAFFMERRQGKRAMSALQRGETPTEELREKETRLFNVLERQTELEQPTERETELKQYEAACEIAHQTIKALAGEIYEDFGDRINEKTSEILSGITRGKYDRVTIDENMEVSVFSQERICKPEQLSMGTLEQIYFAVRMSMGEILSQEEPMPFLLDETFGMYDELRLKQVLQWLAKQKNQIILFTCQKRELEYLDEMGIPYQRIELEGN